MITRVALDAEALISASGTPKDRRGQSQRLAETIRDHGLLSLTGHKDASELKNALEQLTETLGYDFWGPLLCALSESGQGILRTSPERTASTRELCETGALDDLCGVANLVVVNADGPAVPGLPPDQANRLYESHGYADVNSDLELALASFVDLSSTVRSIKQIRSETVIPKGTLDTTLWANYFASLARVSSEVNIYGRHLFSGLTLNARRKHPDLQYLRWFLNQLDRELPARAVVNLYAWPGETMAERSQFKPATPYSIDDISKALRSLEGWNRPSRLHLYLWGGVAHDRHVRFSSGHAIKVNYGLDKMLNFREGRTGDNYGYTFVPKGQSLDILAGDEEKARTSGAHWVLRSKKGGFEAAD